MHGRDAGQGLTRALRHRCSRGADKEEEESSWRLCRAPRARDARRDNIQYHMVLSTYNIFGRLLEVTMYRSMPGTAGRETTDRQTGEQTGEGQVWPRLRLSRGSQKMLTMHVGQG